MRTCTALTLLALLLAAPLHAQEPPRTVIERAIAAHGGHEKLARRRADRVKLRGTLHVGTAALPFTNEQTVQLPGQYKSVVVIQEGTRERSVVHLLDGEQATVLIDGQPQTLGGGRLAQLRQTLQLEQAMRLVPLLADPAFTLQALGEKVYNDHTFVGIRVSGKGQRDLLLYFDKSSGLLVKSVNHLDGPGGKDVVQEAYYADYRDVDGCRRPGKVIAYRDGKKVMEAELVEARHLEQIDAVEFTRP